jgi:non-heme chloroperoxidase
MSQRVTIGKLSALVQRPTAETGPPLLFVHGYFGRAIAFEPMMECLANRGHYCCAPDLRGHGDSIPDCALGDVSVYDYADDIAEVARALNNPIIIGHSMGGLIAQLVAARGCARAIVLLAPAPPRGIPVLSLKLAIAQMRYMPAILTSAIVKPGRADLRALVVNRVPPKEREVILDMFVPDSGRAGREMSLIGIPVERDPVRVPVLVISGNEDRFIPLSRSRRVALRYGADLRVAPGRGHMLILEPGYDEICDWIHDWVTEQELGTPEKIPA